LRQTLHQIPVDRRPIQIQYSNKAAHKAKVSEEPRSLAIAEYYRIRHNDLGTEGQSKLRPVEIAPLKGT